MLVTYEVWFSGEHRSNARQVSASSWREAVQLVIKSRQGEEVVLVSDMLQPDVVVKYAVTRGLRVEVHLLPCYP